MKPQSGHDDTDNDLTYAEFLRVEIRVGTIIKAEPFPDARKPAIKMVIDFGPEIGTRKTSAQITDYYHINNLRGRQVVAVMNFPPKQIADFMSEVLVLGFPDAEGKVVLIEPGHKVPDGGRLY